MNFRHVFVLSLVSFLNPISVMAFENDSADCKRFVEQSIRKTQEQVQPAHVESAPTRTRGQAQTSGNAG
jgi:hypothetical protein